MLHPHELIDQIVEEIRRDPQLWALILDREIESRSTEGENTLGLRPDVMPEAFSDPTLPTRLEVVNDFITQKLGAEDFALATQVSFALRQHAKREIG